MTIAAHRLRIPSDWMTDHERDELLDAASDTIATQIENLADAETGTADVREVLQQSTEVLGWPVGEVNTALAYGSQAGKYWVETLRMTAGLILAAE